ncbi:cell wall-binding repeat-containing protein [Glutamicibacter sp. AOP33-2CA-4]|uniref:cell wall-binding repeat-containing protein n=1 Tax=Glutamicibacter sp. AOP33-2CA-4 TaxID=3457690 RepID=UPI004034EE7D
MPEHRWAGTRLLALSLGAALVLPLAATAPAVAQPTGVTAPSASPSPTPSPSGSAEPASPEPSAPASAPSLAGSAAKAIEDGLAKRTDLSAEERISLADLALDALGEDFIDATMGQGQKRIDESGDPTAPTLAELADLAQEVAVETGQKEELDLAVPGSLEELRTWRPPGPLGIDVSHHQGTVDWTQAYKNGARFGYIKATQSWPSTLFKDPKFNANYAASRNAGVIRGAYHFAMPAHSSGAAQAKEFLANGGGWSADGKTMPPLLDIEWNPYSATAYPQGKGDVCYGMSPAQTVNWIKSFGSTIKASTGRLPMIYTAQSWWDKCTGDSEAFKSWPLHVSVFPTANVPKNPRELPEGWKTFNVWQYSSNSNLIGSAKNVDANVWNGDLTSLRDFAKNTRSTPYRMVTSYLGNADVWPTRLEPVRLYGHRWFDTPVAISKRTFPSSASTVVITSGERFPDALAGSPLASLKNAPLLLTQKNSLPSSVAAELKRLKPKNIVVLGGPIAISESTVKKIKAYGPVTRIWGNDLYDTSALISKNWKTSNQVFLATGERFEDAMSLAAVASGREAPMLLTKKASVPAATIRELKRLKPTRVYLAGGPLAISAKAERQVRNAVPNAMVIRYEGATRYDTSALIAKTFWPKGSQRQFVATADDFRDGLTGAVIASYNDAPLLLTKKSCMPSSVASAMRSMKGWTNVLLGGPVVLDETVAYKKNGQQNIC